MFGVDLDGVKAALKSAVAEIKVERRRSDRVSNVVRLLAASHHGSFPSNISMAELKAAVHAVVKIEEEIDAPPSPRAVK